MTLYSRDAAERLLEIATKASNIVETDSAHLAQLAETIIALYDRLATTPRIIRTTKELTAIDPDTVLLGEESILLTAADCVENSGFPLYDHDRLAVVATGDQVRAARQALEEK